ncbi:MAG: alpha/beta hydrolase [Gammaproteobacteria bacterium]|nr:alpha/beta hydrolase [Gammaproteobacteria bacterium]
MSSIRWQGNDEISNGVQARDLRVQHPRGEVPVVLWQPAAISTPRPLVLLGHGGSGHKRNDRMRMLGNLYAGRYGWNAAAIDGPVHGERGGLTDPNQPAYREMWQRDDTVPGMIADWRATLDALCALPHVDGARVGYWGVSMGTMFGLPLVASEPRIRAAVLGKAGISGSSVQRSGIDRHFREFAPRLSVPVLFSIQWDDERFDRQGQLELYDMLGSRDKRLHAYPGLHVANGPESFDVQAQFLARYL